MSTERKGPAMASPDTERRARARRRWVLAVWLGYGAAYVAVFVAHGEVAVGALAGGFFVLVGLGLIWELRRPSTRVPHLLGWERDERHSQIQLRAAALTGYVALAGALSGGFIAFALSHSPVLWMNALLVLGLAYLAGLVYYARRT